MLQQPDGSDDSKECTSMEDRGFYECKALTTVHYGGTQEDWDALKKNIGEENTPLLNANIICAIQESNGFAYTVTGDEATITSYTGSAENIVIRRSWAASRSRQLRIRRLKDIKHS